MAGQEHELWFDGTSEMTLERFHDEMATKIIRGPSQTLSVWVHDSYSGGSTWKVRRNEHFDKLIKDRWDDMVAFLSVDVVSKHGESSNASSTCRPVSGVTTTAGSGIHAESAAGKAPSSVPENAEGLENAEGTADTCCSPPPSVHADIPEEVVWADLTILPDMDNDGDQNLATEEDKVYEAMGFKAADERAEAAARQSVPIPSMTAEMQNDMNEADVPVDDNVEEEPMFEWDRDNPDMCVGTCYPSMKDFRLAVKQHAVVKEFELATSHSDKQRFRGHCASPGCPWIIRARTQHDEGAN